MQRRHRHDIGSALLERHAVLPPDRRSAREARLVVRGVADEVGVGDLADTAELAVSEVVTNGILHAHTEMVLHVIAYANLICVEVHDRSSALPVARHYADQASTGRGLGLVATVALDCGVEQVADGKVIWFCVGSGADERSAEELLQAWDLDPIEPAEAPSVVLQAMPLQLWLSAREHHDALLRELALFVVEHGLDVDLEQADLARSRISEAVVQATMAGLGPVADIPLHVDPTEVRAFLAMPDTLDLAERFAVSGELLANPGLPEVIAVRDWACEQVVAQLGGAPPAAWPGTDQERFETEVHGRPVQAPTTWDSHEVEGTSEMVIAADDANRIIAVSASLAEQLGWSQDDLIGRRVVTVVPPAYREAHVVGFTRHLSTGERRLLGRTVVLPVLHADGSELTCRIRIEARPTSSRRFVYLAFVDPVTTDDP